MGIPLLGKLIDTHKSELFSSIQLGNCDLVIDGKSFFNQAFNLDSSEFRFGGDYSDFKTQVMDLLDRLIKCTIRPIFVFGGTLDKSRVKGQTVIEREQERLKSAKDAGLGEGSGKKVKPALIWHLVTDLLRQKSIDIVQCAGEADGMMVALANALHAPVLSNNDDFYLFDLEKGYIRFDSEYSKLEPTGEPPSLKAEIYQLDGFLDMCDYPFAKRDMLPIFAFLTNHDCAKAFEEEIEKFCNKLPPVEIEDLIVTEEEHRRMITVLNWLGTKTDIDEAIEEVLQCVDQRKIQPIEQAIGDLIDVYDTASFPISKENWREKITSMAMAPIDELKLPEYLIDLYLSGGCPSVLLTIRQDRKALLSALIEDFTKPSVYDCSLPIRAVAYTILLKDLPSPERKLTVIEISRLKNNDVVKESKRKIEEFVRSDLFSVLPELADIPNLESEQRREIFFKSFSFNDADIEILSSVPSELILFACTFVFWRRVKNQESNKTKTAIGQARALLLCAVALRIKHGDDSTPGKNEVNFDQAPFSPKPKFKPESDRSIVHNFNQWQTCFSAASLLNTILDHPIDPLAPVDHLFHGRIAFSLYTEFTNGKKSKSGALAFFDDKPILKKEFEGLWSKLNKCV